MASQAALSSSFGRVQLDRAKIELMSDLTYERTAGLDPRVEAALNVTGGR